MFPSCYVVPFLTLYLKSVGSFGICRLPTFFSSTCRLCVCVLSRSVILTLCDPVGFNPPGSSVHGSSPGKNTGLRCHFYSRGSSHTRDWNCVSCVSCIGRQILYHCATSEAPNYRLYETRTKTRQRDHRPFPTNSQIQTRESHLVFQVLRFLVQFSHSVVSDSLRPRESQHARPPCP